MPNIEAEEAILTIQVKAVEATIGELEWDTLLLGAFEEATETDTWLTDADKLVGGYLSWTIRENPGSTKWAEMTVIPVCSGTQYRRIILIGLGKPSDVNGEKMRAVMGTAVRAAGKYRSRIVASLLHLQFASAGQALNLAVGCNTEGALMGAYRFDCYKTAATTGNSVPEQLLLPIPDVASNREWDTIIQEAAVLADAVNSARDWVNHPAGYMTPSRMAEQAAQIASASGMKITVLNREAMAEEKMGAFLAVAQGSTEPPKMIVLRYQGASPEQPWTAFVGKGITFDSGGISLKPSENMGDMKGDMAGAAAVLGAMKAVGQLKVKRNIIAIMPCTENMPAGNAYHPGDVLTSMDGKTIEVISTDAEGRLLLADAVTYAKKLGAARIVDVATLTGACVIALGNVTSGVVGNNRDWVDQVMAAAQAAGEKMWEMPYDEEYKEQMKSDIADLKNTGGRPGGMITGGMFIGQFAGETPWLHIDIAGTSDTAKEQGYRVKGATGVGVRTLVQLARDAHD